MVVGHVWRTLTLLLGNVQLAVLLGLFDSENYGWRSMTTPRITGLFNPNCLQAGAEYLMKCYPGDNTYSGPPATDVLLINPDNQFHSVTTTVDVNGEGSLRTWRGLQQILLPRTLCFRSTAHASGSHFLARMLAF